MREASQDVAEHVNLIKKIERAFAELTIPHKDEIVSNLVWAGRLDLDRVETMERLTGREWQRLGRDAIVEHVDALPTLTPEAFRYYMPAFLIDVIHESMPGSNHRPPVSERVIFMIVPVADRKEDRFLVEQTRCFNRKQSQAVYDFLVFQIPTSLDERDLTPDQANQALVFWKAKTEQAGD